MTAVAIAVPVRDEAERLPALLNALARQRGAPPLTVHCLFDGCTDNSAAIARRHAARLALPVVVRRLEQAGAPNAGLARGRACALALADRPGAALLTTDADSAPDPDWVAASLAALRVADVAAGRIEVGGDAPPSQGRLAAYLDRLHRQRRVLDPVEWEDARTHHWTSAASLAFAPGVYATLGGFAPLECGEDGELADRAWRAGFRVRRDAKITVITSARRDGRVLGGFASMLAALDRPAALPLVTHPADEIWRYRHHALARCCFGRGDLRAFARAVRLDPAEAARIAADCPNADAFAARAVGIPPGGTRQVTLAAAERALDVLAAAELAGAA